MRIVLIGSGNVAWHLGLAILETENEIVQVISRKPENAQKLADKLNCMAANHPENMDKNADLYVIAVSDNAISEIIEGYDFNGKLVAHTAGSVSMDVFNGKTTNFGVFYPLQTFSKNREVNMSEVPFFIEANSDENYKVLYNLASSISQNVYSADSEQRKYMHLAAVFANNFLNHLLTISDEILKSKWLPYEILKPLIDETIAKAFSAKPSEMQTGPAIRNDTNTMNEHIEMLRDSPDWQKIYTLVSQNIFDFYKV